jgi:hypothetical protein
VDERELRQPGELYLRGWAASIDDGPLETVDIEVNGAHYRCPTGQRRQDVAAVFEDPRLDTAGWEFRHILAPGDARLRIIVSARTSNDESALLYAGELQRPAPPAGRGDQPVSTSRGILQRLGDLLARLRRAGSSR